MGVGDAGERGSGNGGLVATALERMHGGVSNNHSGSGDRPRRAAADGKADGTYESGRRHKVEHSKRQPRRA